MQWSHFLWFYLQILCAFVVLQQVWCILASMFPAWECGRSPRVEHGPGTWFWFWVLDCASASPCSPTGHRAGHSPVLPAEPPLPVRGSWARQPPKYVTQWHSCSCKSPSCTHRAVPPIADVGVCTHQKLAFTCQVARNLFWCLIIPSLQGSWFPVNST